MRQTLEMVTAVAGNIIAISPKFLRDEENPSIVRIDVNILTPGRAEIGGFLRYNITTNHLLDPISTYLPTVRGMDAEHIHTKIMDYVSMQVNQR